ncbi:hypothetical protein NA56DRAFT_668526 [Hyaloscypha hepaticicola]|uniref:RBR-type E3 ubiquitin transferase n=1 Tax=Hyaloscypha hepaticicola TaxID=2082293 RepID=A0A2J6QG68_9HELO|nr:hypothetical protein NA56DRAFT_668526 [Hyaloscypha hepaticicola]
MDFETATLILQLQLEDSNELFESCEDFERTAAIVADRKMSSSIARACVLDGDVVVESLSQEQAAAGDRDIACTLGGVAAHCSLPPWTVGSEFLDEELAVSRSDGLDGLANESDEDVAESSSWASTKNLPEHTKRSCTACQEQISFFNLARAPCDHEYCRDCRRDLFRASLGDDYLFPPRCCRQSIATGSSIRIFLTGDLVHRYEQKKIEFDTPDRTYCANPLCSAIIRGENITNEQAFCPNCLTSTCTICSKASHTGDFPEDVALQQALDAAEQHGWQRCYNCRRFVELEIGCNHITCHCSAQFCYTYGERWKTCTCAQWNEDRLIARANQVVARQPVRVDPPQQAGRIAAVVQNLRDRHNSDHQSWQYIRGSHQCEECRHELPSYIFECRQCNIQACNRCRSNRL